MKKITIRRILLCTLVLITGGCNLPSPGHVPAPADQTGTAAEIPAETKEAAVQKHTAAPVSRADLTPTLTFTPSPVPTDTPTPTPTFGPTPTPTLGPGYFHGSLWYDIGFVSQEGLKMGSKPVNTGCTPASIQMVLDFWHQYNEDYPTMSAQQMININVSQNQFRSSSGMNIMDAEDELRNMGYYLGSRTDSDKQELLAALERYGPVLVLTKVNWTPFGANHMAVVTGYDPESGYIRLMDPWQIGGIMEFSYEGFDGIWGLNYLADEGDVLQRAFFFIVPYAELERDNEPFIPYYKLQEIHSRN